MAREKMLCFGTFILRAMMPNHGSKTFKKMIQEERALGHAVDLGVRRELLRALLAADVKQWEQELNARGLAISRR